MSASRAGPLVFSDTWVKQINMLHEQRTQFKRAEISSFTTADWSGNYSKAQMWGFNIGDTEV